MNTSNRCPICGEPFDKQSELDHHVAFTHFYVQPPGHYPEQPICWCGLRAWRRDLILHFQSHGGADRHYFSCLLGVSDA